jgi:hypothetical protein
VKTTVRTITISTVYNENTGEFLVMFMIFTVRSVPCLAPVKMLVLPLSSPGEQDPVSDQKVVA